MKCVKCYREIDEHLKFCTYCGAKQPVDREAYEREHPELAEALSDDELLEQQRQRQVMEAERKAREEAERKVKEEVERKLREEAERKAKSDAERRAKEESELSLIICPNCGQEVSSDVNFCPNCAHPIAFLKKEDTEVESHQDITLPPPLTDVDDNHHINVPPLPEEEPTVLPLQGNDQEEYFHCPTCGATVRQGESSCISCGQVFDWSDITTKQQSTPSQAGTTQSSDNDGCCCSSVLRIAVIVIAALVFFIIALIKCSGSDSMTIENAEEYGNIVQENDSYNSNYHNDYELESQRIADEAEANAKRTYEEARANAERAYEEARIAAERAVNEARATSHYNYDDENYDDELDDEEESSY